MIIQLEKRRGDMETPSPRRRSPRITKGAPTSQAQGKDTSTIKIETKLRRSPRLIQGERIETQQLARLRHLSKATYTEEESPEKKTQYDKEPSLAISASGAAESVLQATSLKWLSEDLKNLKTFEYGSVAKFAALPEKAMNDELKYLWQSYYNLPAAKAIEKGFETTFSVSELLSGSEWPKFIEFIGQKDREHLSASGNWPPVTNSLRGKLFERYKDRINGAYIAEKALELFESELKRIKSKDAALVLMDKLENDKQKCSISGLIFQKKKVLIN